MASEGVSSSWRRSGGQFGSSSHPNGKDGKDGVSPKCFCGENTILFSSKTRSNSDRLFLGCLFYKARQPYCKLFLRLDEHVLDLD
ncbi:hypothetical protein Ahy_Scaffold5g107807 [Arachis hypogaea]|uniref:Uncharacterized protein n=1 Tax=Arachis hypogaea TaxID=3818 RepID=A0A444WQ86_ARAHY|nr:hypothetical protein Ahy_Scaffold5g107807 [Arachis hypogaea]